MADTLLFRGGSTADIALAGNTTVNDREIVIDTETNQVVLGSAKDRTLMLSSQGQLKEDSIRLGSSLLMHPDADDINVAGPGNIGLTFRCPTTAQGAIYFADGVNGQDRERGKVVYDHSDNSLRLHTNVGERLHIDSDGKIESIGSNNPGAKLEVARLGSAWTGVVPGSGIAVFIHNGNNLTTSPAALQISGGSTAHSSVYFGDESDADVGEIKYGHEADYMLFRVGGNTKRRVLLPMATWVWGRNTLNR